MLCCHAASSVGGKHSGFNPFRDVNDNSENLIFLKLVRESFGRPP